MAGKKTGGRQKILDTTASLMRTQGYHGTGLNQIIKESKVPKGSLYFHFPGGKEEIACESLKLSLNAWIDELLAEMAPAQSLEEAITLTGNRIIRELKESNFENGCPMATVALEQAPYSDRIHELFAEHTHRWIEEISRFLAGFGMSDAQQERLAYLFLSATEGAYVLCKAQRSTKPMEIVMEQMATLGSIYGEREI